MARKQLRELELPKEFDMYKVLKKGTWIYKGKRISKFFK